ncbi:MAG: helix-turn-helix domain-containing protein [Leadbetterella sp.]|nr:helix-turn-helix domain-containing protein [Leadbetterella sp.]
MSDLNIRKIRKSLKLTQEELAKKLGVHYKTIQNWEKGGTIPESKRILIRNLELSLTDKIKDYDPLSDNQVPARPNIREGEIAYAAWLSNQVSLLPLSARSLEINEAHFQQSGSSYEKVQSPVKGADFATVLSGDGLGPEFPDGAIVFFRHIDPELFIEWGKVHAVSTRNGLIIKRLNPGSKPDTLLCSCSDPLLDSFEIPANSPDMHFYKAIACTSIK